MKLIPSVLLLIVFSTNLNAQRPKKPEQNSSSFPPIAVGAKQLLMQDAFVWKKNSDFPSPNVVSYSSAAMIVRDSQHPLQHTRPEQLLTQYRSNIATWIRKSSYVDGGQLQYIAGKFDARTIYDVTVTEPLSLYDKDGQIVLAIPGILRETLFNTLRSTERVRASRIAVSTVLPLLKSIPDEVFGGEVKYVFIHVAYGSADFGDKHNKSGESMGVVASLENCMKLKAERITDEEFVQASDVYISYGSLEFAKVQLRLE